MAKLAGDHVQVLADGFELTGDSNRISIDEGRDLFDITAFGDEVHKFSPGQRMMALQHAGFMNSADGALASGIAGGGGGWRCSRSTWVRMRRRRLAIRSSVCWRGRGRYGALPQVNQMIPFRAGFANRGEDGGWGIALTQPVDVTGTTSGQRRWTMAAPAMAAVWHACMCWRRPLAMPMSSRLKVRARGAFAGEESVLGDLRAWMARALGSELAAINGTIPRYARWRATAGSERQVIAIAHRHFTDSQVDRTKSKDTRRREANGTIRGSCHREDGR